jgi:hypothetical protein
MVNENNNRIICWKFHTDDHVLSVMTVGGQMFCFASVSIILQFLETLLNNIKIWNEQRKVNRSKGITVQSSNFPLNFNRHFLLVIKIYKTAVEGSTPCYF